MRLRTQRGLRRRGGSFTFLVLAVSVLLLATATVLVDAARSSFRYGSEQVHQIRLREAAFAGVTWARVAHARGDARHAGALHLESATVEVEYRAQDQGLHVVSLAKAKRQWVRVVAELVPGKDGRLVIGTFELHLVDPRKAKAAKTAKTAKTAGRRDF